MINSSKKIFSFNCGCGCDLCNVYNNCKYYYSSGLLLVYYFDYLFLLHCIFLHFLLISFVFGILWKLELSYNVIFYLIVIYSFPFKFSFKHGGFIFEVVHSPHDNFFVGICFVSFSKVFSCERHSIFPFLVRGFQILWKISLIICLQQFINDTFQNLRELCNNILLF